MRCVFNFVITLFAILCTVTAAPVQVRVAPTLKKRNCNPMPSEVDPAMRDLIYREVRKETKDDKVLKIVMCTAITESLVNNLYCGDQDSLGLFQMRPSMGWGTPEQINDPVYAVHRFLKAMLPIYRDNPDLPINVIAQNTQNAQAGDQYWRNIDFAAKLIEEARQSVGDSEDGPPSNTETATQPAGGGGAVNIDVPTQSSGDKSPAQPTKEVGQDDVVSGTNGNDNLCEQYYTPVAGDYCKLVAERFNLTLEQFYELNQEIDSDCSNLVAGQDYCVAPASN